MKLQQHTILKVIYTAVAQVTSVIPHEYSEWQHDTSIEFAVACSMWLAKSRTAHDNITLSRLWLISAHTLSQLEKRGVITDPRFQEIRRRVDAELARMILEKEIVN